MLLILGFAASMLQTPAQTDACAALIPAAVRQAAAKRFPRYELPHEADNTPDDIRDFRARGESACLGVAVGRFTGKPANDYALLLTEPKSRHTLLVVATEVRHSWRLALVKDWGDGPRPDLFVWVAEPGRYRRHVDTDIESDGFTSATPGVLTGAIEKFSEAYFFTAGHWSELPQSY